MRKIWETKLKYLNEMFNFKSKKKYFFLKVQNERVSLKAKFLNVSNEL